MNNKLMFSSNTDLWATPQEFYDKLNCEFGFTLDPCATKDNYKCDKYYTVEDNGLLQSWDHEVVFCNPPYGRGIGEWVKKGFNAKDSVVVMLLPARTDTKWFHDYIYNKCEIRFIKGRLKFGGSQNSAPFPSMVCVYRNLGVS